MTRTAGPLFASALALTSAQASAQAGAAAPAVGHPEVDQKAVPSEPQRPTPNPPTADDVCRTLEEAAAENGLPVEFFARVIWQESRFNARLARAGSRNTRLGAVLVLIYSSLK